MRLGLPNSNHLTIESEKSQSHRPELVNSDLAVFLALSVFAFGCSHNPTVLIWSIPTYRVEVLPSEAAIIRVAIPPS